MKHIVKFILFITPVLLILAGANYYVDSANFLHKDVAENIAKSVAEGKPAGIKRGFLDERLTREYLIQYMEKPECVALGASTIMTLSEDGIKNSGKFYNLGVSAATSNDILAMLGGLLSEDKLPDKLIIGIDNMFFSKDNVDSGTQWEEWALYAMRAEEELGQLSLCDKIKYYTAWLHNKMTFVKNLFSIAYFQSSMEVVGSPAISATDERWAYAGDDTEEAFLWGDGSRVYTKKAQKMSENEVKEESIKYITPGSDLSTHIDDVIIPFSSMDSEQKELFEDMMNYLEGQGVEVELFLCPIEPTVWKYILENKERYKIMFDIEKYINDYGMQHDVRVVGSYDPHKYNLETKDFYDARHLRKEVVNSVFDFGEWK